MGCFKVRKSGKNSKIFIDEDCTITSNQIYNKGTYFHGFEINDNVIKINGNLGYIKKYYKGKLNVKPVNINYYKS